MKIVIVGGVAGGGSAAARLRRLDENAEIVILEQGGYVSFANCGLPYHLSGEIAKRDDLFVASAEQFRGWFDIEVRTGHEVTVIDRENRRLRVLVAGGEEYHETYDKLILSQGAAPLRPELPGADDPRIFTLRTIPDMDAIMARMAEGATGALVVGSGYIGLEAVEALRRRGLEVDLVELQNQVMPVLDPEIASDVQQHLEKHGVRVHLATSPEEFADAAGRLETALSDGSAIVSDLVIMAAGVRPRAELAIEAGLEIGSGGGIAVDEHMRTSDPDIYAAGDMVEVTDTVTGLRRNMPLAGPANRQGRIAADHIAGRPSGYTTTQSTAIVKVFDMTVATTGACEKSLVDAGRELYRHYHKIHLHPFGHASYYPGTASMHAKVLFDAGGGRLLGAQIAGFDGVDKRIDVLAVAVRAGMTVYDLEHLELAYAPPYGSAKDPVNMAGFVGTNILEGIVGMWYADEYPQRTASGTVLDVRTAIEYRQGHVPGARHVPLHLLRERIGELDDVRSGPVFIYCLSGVRSYIASRILMQAGFSEVYNLSGGIMTFRSCHPQLELEKGAAARSMK